MNRVALIDFWATSGRSWLHRASPLAKWSIIAAAVAVAILSRQPYSLLLAYVALLLAALSARLPWRPLVLGSLLPAPLFGIYAISQWQGNWEPIATLLGKGMVTALAGLLIAATTPYPDLLAPLTRVLPPVIADSLVLTYRSIFILASQAEGLVVTIRARGGLPRRPASDVFPWKARGTTLGRRLDVVATGSALALLRGVDLSNRLYDVMRLRGYTGRLAPSRTLALQPADWRVAVLTIAVVAPAIAARIVGLGL
jgi:energy-coupling factor transporter transmembrane protein EcfT